MGRVAESECTIGVATPGEEFAGSGERAVVVVTQYNCDNAFVLEGRDHFGTGIWFGIGVSHEYNGGRAGRVGDEGSEVG
jgi:hypothetical protein